MERRHGAGSRTGDPGVDPFRRDATLLGGYAYSQGARLSSRLANERMTQAVLACVPWRGARVIDIGCGDGSYTAELARRSGAAAVHGVDPATEAIAVATARADGPTYAVGDAYALPHPDGAFDLAHLRGVVHHVDRPLDALREALRVAPVAVLVEPNGYNAGLKLLERVSPYHVRHGERSFTPRRLRRWLAQAGAQVERARFVGFVPMFSPDWYARAAKRVEPALERTPGLRTLACAQWVAVATRR